MKNRIMTSEIATKLAVVATSLCLVANVGCSSSGGTPPTPPGAGAGVGGNGRGPSPVILGTASNYVILAEAAITSIPPSPVVGHVGLSPASGSFMGIICSQVSAGSNIYVVDAAGPACAVNDAAIGDLTTAVSDKANAETNANGRAADYNELATGLLGGLNLGPATYKWTSDILVASDLTLTGGPNDVWIFITTGKLTLSTGVHITLAGGALARNVYWSIAQDATLNTTSAFKGTIISHSQIAMKSGSTIEGRLLAHTAVTLDASTITKP